MVFSLMISMSILELNKVIHGFLFFFLAAIELIAQNIKNSHIDIWLIEAKLTYKGYLNDTCYVYTNYHKF